ncbi:MAG: hypothetical protein ABIP75_08490 [Pyrinomonadaceae bacterium]
MKKLLVIISCGLIATSVCLGQKPEKAEPVVTQAPADSLTLADPSDAKKTTPAAPETEVKSALPALTVEQIMAKYRAGLGSTFTKQKITSTTAIGTFSLTTMGLTGALEINSKAPNKQVSSINLPGFGLILEGFDGTDAWAQDPINGLRSKTGIEFAQTKNSSIFDREEQLEKLYPKMELKGTEKVKDRDAYVIQATSVDAGEETWYFDVETFHLIRQDSVAESAQGKIPVQSYFEDFRAVNGVLIPFVSRLVSASGNVEVRLTEVKTNVMIDDAKFSKPKPAASKPAPAVTTPATKPGQ